MQANAVEPRSLSVGYFHAPGVRRRAIADVFNRKVPDAGAGLGARRLQGRELGPFLIGNDRCAVPDIEVVSQGNELSVRNWYIFRTNTTRLLP
jgi:hypothetical protein